MAEPLDLGGREGFGEGGADVVDFFRVQDVEAYVWGFAIDHPSGDGEDGGGPDFFAGGGVEPDREALGDVFGLFDAFTFLPIWPFEGLAIE